MSRAIITYRIITLNHITIDEVEFSENKKTVSVKAPDDFNNKYRSYDDISSYDLIQFNKIVHNPTICYKNHLDDPNALDEYQKQIKRCESEYYFAISGQFIIPKFTKMEISYDYAGAFHDGYCSGAECELQSTENAKTKIVDLPDELLGLYEDEDKDEDLEIPITNKMRQKYEFENDISHYGTSGYCDKPESDNPIFNKVVCCNTEYYFINKIVLCQ